MVNGKGDRTPLRVEWVDVNDEEEGGFKVVRSRKKRERKPTVIIARPTTRSQKNETYMGRKNGSPAMSPSTATRKEGHKKKNPI